ncbi:MAG: uroporphyrinogen-III synthase, partial [Pseudomonadota bacterium]
LVPLFSPRTAAQFAQEVSAAQHVHVIAISAAVARALGGAVTSKVHIAAAPTGEEMVRAIEFLLRRKTFA